MEERNGMGVEIESGYGSAVVDALVINKKKKSSDVLKENTETPPVFCHKPQCHLL